MIRSPPRESASVTNKNQRIEKLLSEKSKTDEPAEPYDVTEQVGHLLRKAYQRHLGIFSDIASDTLRTSVQFVTLCMLQAPGGCSQAELVRATAVDQTTIRGVVERLKARGLVELNKDAEDGRKVVIALTKSGSAILEQMYPKAREITEATLANLNPAERLALNFLLRKMMADPASED